MTEAPRSPSGTPAAPPAPAAVPTRARAAAVRLAAPAAALAAAGGALAYVGVVDPNEPGHYPVCPLLRLTGLLCPGCGGLRAAHALAHGDPVTALGANAPAVVAAAVLAVRWVLWCVRRARGPGPQPRTRPGPRPGSALRPRAVHGWAAGVLVLAFTVVRNLPFGMALAP